MRFTFATLLDSLRSVFISLLAALLVWAALPPLANASIHTYYERPGQVTVRSRQSLRDFNDRAWQAIAFKRFQGDMLQGIYLRLVGFPGAVQVDDQQTIALIAPTGQQLQLHWSIDPQTKELPVNVGQYDLQPFLANLDNPLPLELQVPLMNGEVAEFAIAPFIVQEWLQIKTAKASPAPVSSPLGK